MGLSVKSVLRWIFIVILGLGLAPARLHAQAAPSAVTPASSTTSQADRIAALEKQVADNTAATTAAQMAGDNSWMLVSSALVLMMSAPGLALFYGGLVRKKNILGTMMQTFAMMGVVTVLWALVTYSLAFGTGNAFIGGLHNAFLHGVGLLPDKDYAATIPLQTFMVYQLMFAIITPALITGAFAERVKFSGMLVFMVLWALVVYSPMAHMVWGVGGLLNVAGAIPGTLGGRFPCLDFAGGTVVHVTSGVSALVTALYLGKRLGYPKVAMPPHSVVLSFVGAALLWVGWFGFNAGSALGAGTLATSPLCGDTLWRGGRRLWLVGGRVDPEWQAFGPGRDLGRGRRPGRHHPRRRVRDADVCPVDRFDRGGLLLFHGRDREEHLRLRRLAGRLRGPRRGRHHGGHLDRHLRQLGHQSDLRFGQSDRCA